MNLLFFFPIFILASLTVASPVPQEGRIAFTLGRTLDAECLQGYWIIEAIVEGDIGRAIEIIGEHVNHVIATGKNISDIWGILLQRLMARLDKIKDESLKAKLREALIRLQRRLEELKEKIENGKNKDDLKTFSIEFSLIEDIKEVINQIKNQGGSLVDTVGNIADILNKMFG